MKAARQGKKMYVESVFALSVSNADSFEANLGYCQMACRTLLDSGHNGSLLDSCCPLLSKPCT